MAPWVQIPPPPPDMETEDEGDESLACEAEESGSMSHRSPQEHEPPSVNGSTPVDLTCMELDW